MLSKTTQINTLSALCIAAFLNLPAAGAADPEAFGNGGEMLPVMVQNGDGMGFAPGEPHPLPEACIEDPASCDLTEEQVADMQACLEDPASDACGGGHRPPQPPCLADTDDCPEDGMGERPKEGEEGRPLPPPGPRPLSEECIADPASCGLSEEQVTGMLACEEDSESEACIAHRQTFETMPVDMVPACPEGAEVCIQAQEGGPHAQPHGPRPPLDASCLQDPAACGLDAEKIEGLQMCRGNHSAEDCQAFRERNADTCRENPEDPACELKVGGPVLNCDNDPALCDNPGPAIFDMDSLLLRVHAVRLRLDGQLSEDFYSVEMKLNPNGEGLSLLELRALNREARGENAN